MSFLDGDLLGHAAAGDDDAVAHLLERHAATVRRRISGMIPRRWRSVLSEDDVLQQTHVDVFRDIRRLRLEDEDAFVAWLTRVAKRNCLDALRMLSAEKRGGNRRKITPTTREDSCVDLFERLGGISRGPSRAAAREEACSALQRALESLPGTYRQVVEMYDLADHPVEEVAAAIGRSRGATFMLRSRAHRMLAEIMGTASRYVTSS